MNYLRAHYNVVMKAVKMDGDVFFQLTLKMGQEQQLTAARLD
ncbi:uncharacterized protein J3R85_004753 [Psidium guajava]|nr:uncharacterized protein J3R85_004753 [Psidium guajava]